MLYFIFVVDWSYLYFTRKRWLLRKWLLLCFSFYKTPLAETGCLSILFIYYYYFFFGMLTHSVYNSLTCDLGDTIPHQRSLTLLPREVEDFPRGDRHFKLVLLLTYLIYLSPKTLYMLGLFKRYGYLAMNYNVSYEI